MGTVELRLSISTDLDANIDEKNLDQSDHEIDKDSDSISFLLNVINDYSYLSNKRVGYNKRVG